MQDNIKIRYLIIMPPVTETGTEISDCHRTYRANFNDKLENVQVEIVNKSELLHAEFQFYLPKYLLGRAGLSPRRPMGCIFQLVTPTCIVTHVFSIFYPAKNQSGL